jgi:tetratricopeptide repeat protein
LPPLVAPASVVEPARVAEPAVASVWQPAHVAELAAASAWQPASAAGAAPSGAPPALDEGGHRGSSPMPGETGIARVGSSWPAAIEPAHGPYPLAAPDPAASLPAGPGSPRGRRDRLATVKTRGLLAVAASRRKVLWIGGAAGGVALVVILVLVGGGKPRTVATSERAGEHAQAAVSSRTTPAAPDVQAAPARTTAARETPAVASPPAPLEPAKPPVSDAPAVRPAPRPAKQLGGKKLVVEYIEREGEVATPGLVAQSAEDPAVGRARSAYLSGNQKLFAGDAGSAIRAYRQALSLYPGYVGGYRGLGLAYAQLGEAPKALEAFRTYVTAVPNAKDITLIRKRIARLQGK